MRCAPKQFAVSAPSNYSQYLASCFLDSCLLDLRRLDSCLLNSYRLAPAALGPQVFRTWVSGLRVFEPRAFKTRLLGLHVAGCQRWDRVTGLTGICLIKKKP